MTCSSVSSNFTLTVTNTISSQLQSLALSKPSYLEEANVVAPLGTTFSATSSTGNFCTIHSDSLPKRPFSSLAWQPLQQSLATSNSHFDNSLSTFSLTMTSSSLSTGSLGALPKIPKEKNLTNLLNFAFNPLQEKQFSLNKVMFCDTLNNNNLKNSNSDNSVIHSDFVPSDFSNKKISDNFFNDSNNLNLKNSVNTIYDQTYSTAVDPNCSPHQAFHSQSLFDRTQQPCLSQQPL